MEEKNATNTAHNGTRTPEDAGGRTFTQEEVNRIVSERLQKERSKAALSAADQREADLQAREARLTCREFVTEKGYPLGLLDVLDTSDFERFQAALQKLDEIIGLPSKDRVIPRFTGPAGNVGGMGESDALADAFKPKF